MIHTEGGPEKQSAKDNLNEVKKFSYETYQQLWLKIGLTRENYNMLTGTEVNRLLIQHSK